MGRGAPKTSGSFFSWVPPLRWSLMAAVLAGGAGCVADSGLLVILQNQQPVVDDATQTCNAGTMPSPVAVGAGVLDLEVGMPPAYVAYPIIQSRLPSRAAVVGGSDPNTVYLDGVRGTLYPPPGLTVEWPLDCPGTFFSPSAVALLPGASQGTVAQVIRPCQAQRIHDLFSAGILPPDLTQQVLFTVEMRAVGRLASGDEVLSDAFRFSVRMCTGCLQTGFSDLAQMNWPNRPPCSAAPKPNPHHGNPCNVAQDWGPLLCCTGDDGLPVCPAPDM
jgi:hypothetical protein